MAAWMPSLQIKSIPLVVVLWEKRLFGGVKRTLPSWNIPKYYPDEQGNCFDLGGIDFSEQTQAIGIHAGPNFNPNEKRTVSFFEETKFQGAELCLAQGVYGSLRGYGDMGGRIKSMRFNSPAPNARLAGFYEQGSGQAEPDIEYSDTMAPAKQIKPIPLVVRLYTDVSGYDKNGYIYDSNATRNHLTLVEDAPNLRNMFGSQYDESAKIVEVQGGPDYDPQFDYVARLYEDALDDPRWKGQEPPHLDVRPTDDPDPADRRTGTVNVAFGVITLYVRPYEFDKKTRAMKILATKKPK